jgi:hypothetical protein
MKKTTTTVHLLYETRVILKQAHTYHSRFIPVGVAKTSQIFLRDAHDLPKFLAMSNTADVTGDMPIAV